MIKQLLNSAVDYVKNYGDLAGCYLDLHNSSDDTQPHSIIAKYLRVRDMRVRH